MYLRKRTCVCVHTYISCVSLSNLTNICLSEHTDYLAKTQVMAQSCTTHSVVSVNCIAPNVKLSQLHPTGVYYTLDFLVVKNDIPFIVSVWIL